MTLPSDGDPKLWLALLHEIDVAGGQAHPNVVCATMRGYFPAITDEDIERRNIRTGQNTWINRVHWARQNLRERGCLEGARGIWRLTPIGKQWLDAKWRGPNADYSALEKPPSLGRSPRNRASGIVPIGQHATDAPSVWPPQTSKPTIVTAETAAAASDIVPTRPARAVQDGQGYLTAIPDPVDHLTRRLQESQRKSGAPQQFERDLAETFEFLGFDAQHIGGAGETDIFVRAALGPLSYSAVIDAKSTHTGRVMDSQINWPVIDAHRQGRGATFAVVVGEDFSGGQLQKFADLYKVTLLTTSMLIELLRLHAGTPLSLRDMRDLFAASGRADAGIQTLGERAREHARHWQLIAQIIDTIGRYERQRPGGFAPKVEHMHLLLETQALNAGQPYTVVPTPQEVEDAITFLASRAVGILADVPGSNGAYHLVVSPETARRRLRALARMVDAPRDAAATATLNRAGGDQG
jgi:hypothetical protein